MSLTPELLADLRKKAEAANVESPSPWENQPDPDKAGHYAGRSMGIIDAVGNDVVKTDAGVYPPEPPVADFIATAHPAVVLALLDRIETLQRTVNEWQLATRCGAPVDAGLLRRINLEVAANLCANVADAQRIRAHAEILRP